MMDEMTGVGERVQGHVGNEFFETIEILAGECVIVQPPDHQRRNRDRGVAELLLSFGPTASYGGTIVVHHGCQSTWTAACCR